MIRWNSDHDQEVSFYSMVSYLREVIERIGNASGFCIVVNCSHRKGHRYCPLVRYMEDMQ